MGQNAWQMRINGICESLMVWINTYTHRVTVRTESSDSQLWNDWRSITPNQDIDVRKGQKLNNSFGCCIRQVQNPAPLLHECRIIFPNLYGNAHSCNHDSENSPIQSSPAHSTVHNA